MIIDFEAGGTADASQFPLLFAVKLAEYMHP